MAGGMKVGAIADACVEEVDLDIDIHERKRR
jgi:hypothetical protein